MLFNAVFVMSMSCTLITETQSMTGSTQNVAAEDNTSQAQEVNPHAEHGLTDDIQVIIVIGLLSSSSVIFGDFWAKLCQWGIWEVLSTSRYICQRS